MKYRYMWALLEILAHFSMYYFNLRGTLLGKILVPYRYSFLLIFILVMIFFFKKENVDEGVRITFYAGLTYLLLGIPLGLLI